MAVKRFLLLALIFSVMVTTAPALADGDFYVIAGGGGVGTKITSLPYTISTPGFYYLSKDLSTSGAGITVNASHVTIDLMGFSLVGNDKTNTGIYMSGKTNVEVRNGTVRYFDKGIFEDSGNGANHRIINVRVEVNSIGIWFYGSGHLVKGCTAAGNSNTGIYMDGGNISYNVLNNNSTGIYLGEGTITGNTIKNAAVGPAPGILCVGTGSIIGNTVTCNTGQSGIVASPGGSPVVVDQNSVGGSGTHYTTGSGTIKTISNAG
jgi:hypothetical protein